MTGDPRSASLAFLTGEHGLSPDEAEAALGVAAAVLRSGLDRLEAALAGGGAPAVQEAAHALKGSLLNLGLDQLAASAQALIVRSREGDPDGCRRLARELAHALAPFFPA